MINIFSYERTEEIAGNASTAVVFNFLTGDGIWKKSKVNLFYVSDHLYMIQYIALLRHYHDDSIEDVRGFLEEFSKSSEDTMTRVD